MEAPLELQLLVELEARRPVREGVVAVVVAQPMLGAMQQQTQGLMEGTDLRAPVVPAVQQEVLELVHLVEVEVLVLQRPSVALEEAVQT